MHPLPCVLVACVKDDKILLWKRKKRPYDDHWSLPGGRLRFSETMAEATARILKEKTFMDGEMISVNALLSEKNVDEDDIKHSYLLILTRAEPLGTIKGSDTVQWFPLESLPDKMIPSDRWFVENKRDSKMEFKEERLISQGDALSIEFC
ncbi:NUDIX hydrolase [Candidatus Woesearchaeota archaeon]|nr:NUDIX hydrolase [Candidatus Woesearchaeota archaeon]